MQVTAGLDGVAVPVAKVSAPVTSKSPAVRSIAGSRTSARRRRSTTLKDEALVTVPLPSRRRDEL